MTSKAIAEILETRMQDNATMLRDLPRHVTDRQYPARGSGWLEYRFMSLMERTRRFASDYCDRYYWIFGRRVSFDYETSSEEFATLWKMRHSADIYGVSYPVYLDVAFHLYRNDRYADRLATPNLIFARRVASRTWRKRFTALLDERRYAEYSRLPRMAQFWLEHDRGLPAQTECRQRLLNLAKQSRRYKYVAEAFAVRSKIMPLDDILQVVPDAEDRADIEATIKREVAGSIIPVEEAPAMEGSLLQTCFGLPRVLAGFTNPCSSCVHQPACALAASKLGREAQVH